MKNIKNNDGYKYVFKAYEYSESISIMIDNDMLALNYVLKVCSNQSFSPEIVIQFYLELDGKQKEELLLELLEDAKKTGQILAQDKELTLKKTIYNKFSTVSFITNQTCVYASQSNDFSLDINPRQQEIKDVKVIFEAFK